MLLRFCETTQNQRSDVYRTDVWKSTTRDAALRSVFGTRRSEGHRRDLPFGRGRHEHLFGCVTWYEYHGKLLCRKAFSVSNLLRLVVSKTSSLKRTRAFFTSFFAFFDHLATRDECRTHECVTHVTSRRRIAPQTPQARHFSRRLDF